MLGLGKASVKYRDLSLQAERRMYRIILLGVLLIAIPLVLTSVRVARDSHTHLRARQLTQEWINASEVEHELNRISVNSGDVLIELDGPQDLTSLSELRQRLAESLPPFETAILRINFAKDLPIEQVIESDS
jgi:Tfp pilus assembly protein PilN